MARFRTRARAVDMLGRQQIAGVPTAISELFKNAHDAYADNAIVDYFRSDRLFILRDDGTGMTEQDFESRWLTLATESKVATAGGHPATGRPGYPRREILGEKGIGRLAVAAIGPQALILSRPLRDGKLGDLLVSMIHWGLFELPGIDLDQIEIPTLTLPGSRLPGEDEVGTLVDWVAENLNSVKEGASRQHVARVRAELKSFRDIDPEALASGALQGPSLADGPGTHFYIRPADSLITEDLVARDRNEPSDLLKLLIGFTNTMTPDHRPPALAVEFRDHYSEEDFDNVVAETKFFTPAEFEAADHRIQGAFDEKGQFRGLVRIFDADPVEIVIPYPKARGEEAPCGPFRLDVAYQQGEQRRTLHPEAFAEIDAKLKLYGGLYIYRDGIRVLPYGNQDFDFLDFERRRNISASDYFFSYRRMFGVVEITRASNSELREKAGREGFTANEAYRQFREQLMNLFYQIAFQFFRETGSRADVFYERRDELERLEKARRRRARQVSARRSQVARQLSEFEAALDENQMQEEVARIVRTVEAGLEQAAADEDLARAAATVARVEDRARSDLAKANEVYKVERPRGMALSKQLARRYARYEDQRARIEEELLEPTRSQIDRLISDTVKKHKLQLARQLRLEHAVIAAVQTARSATRGAQRELNAAAKQTQQKAADLGKQHYRGVEDTAARMQAELASLDISNTTDRRLVAFRARVERDLSELRDAATANIASVTHQLENVVWPEHGGPAVSMLDAVEALETDVEALSEQAADQFDLAQLGMAVEVINHEFRQTVQSIRRTLRQLKVWADANPKLRGPYGDLKSSFDHLDGYLTLFTPLQRRLQRTEVEIAGSEIETFVEDLFAKRLSDNDIELLATEAFRQHRLVGHPSTIYPVFVNLVDNSVFWLTGYRGERTITLDASDGWMGVRDTGPGLPADLGEDIFEARVTTKPGGSGYGLFIARQVLERDGMRLIALPPSADAGAEIRIVQAES